MRQSAIIRHKIVKIILKIWNHVNTKNNSKDFTYRQYIGLQKMNSFNRGRKSSEICWSGKVGGVR